MVDVHTSKQRSYNMSKIKAAETKAELKLKKFFKILGFSYQPKIFMENRILFTEKKK